MSNDTLTDLITESIGHNIAPLLKWIYATFAAVIIATSSAVAMYYNMTATIAEAKREAVEAKTLASSVMATVAQHSIRLAVHESSPHPRQGQ